MARTINTLTVPSNCKMSSRQWGEREITIDTLGYGMSIVTNEEITRSQKVIYPFRRTSGTWYVNAIFPEYQMWRSFQNWIYGFIGRATDPHRTIMQPLKVEVASEEFSKLGYPTSTIAYGNDWDAVVYQSMVTFASASDPETMSGNASRFRRATNDATAATFYPAGFQSTELPRPVPTTFNQNNPDAIYDRNPGNRGDNIPIPN